MNICYYINNEMKMIRHLSNFEEFIQPFQIKMCIVQEIVSAKAASQE